MIHKPVLLKEIVELLDLKPGLRVLDGTIGLAGHASEIAKRIGKKGILIGFDLDQNALDQTAVTLKNNPTRTILLRENFRDVIEVLKRNGVVHIDRALLDLGLSSLELEHSGRGFSFQKDEPLIMTFADNPKKGTLTAFDVINTWSEESLADVIYGFSGESFARRIAKAVVGYRKQKLIQTSGELTGVIKGATPAWYRNRRLNPATKTFQAIRIAVNDEVNVLKEGLNAIWKVLEMNGRLAVISFHEVEDRIVKNFFKEKDKEKLGKIITKKPIIPTRAEIKENPRARSAKLRVITKIKYI